MLACGCCVCLLYFRLACGHAFCADCIWKYIHRLLQQRLNDFASTTGSSKELSRPSSNRAVNTLIRKLKDNGRNSTRFFQYPCPCCRRAISGPPLPCYNLKRAALLYKDIENIKSTRTITNSAYSGDFFVGCFIPK